MATKIKNNYKSKSTSHTKKYFLLAILLVMVGVTTYIANVLIQRSNTYQVGASAGNALLFFEPQNLSTPPNALVNVWATTDKPVGFVRAEFTFDHTLLRLNQEISLAVPALSRIVKVSTMSEANSTGKVQIHLGIDPAQLSSAPSGSFKIASLSLSPRVTTPNLISQLNMFTSNLQLVDTSAVPFIVSSDRAVISINPISSPTPSPSLAASPTPTPSSDAVPPTISITSPVNNAYIPSNTRVTIQASATDNVAVSRVVFYVNNIVQCTVTAAPYTCQWTTPRGNKTPQIRAVATDTSGNSASSTVTIRTR